MNKVIQFFGYEQCYNYYKKRIATIRQAKIHEKSLWRNLL